MKNITIFCLTLEPSHEDTIKYLSYIPVGLGNKNFSSECFSDKKNNNISKKNPFYGEYTFHYWLWKNFLDQIETDWVGFCQYRKFFAKKHFNSKNISLSELKSNIITNLEEEMKSYDCILGTKFSVNHYKISKILKNHLIYFLKKPAIFFNKKKRNLSMHFDLFHGEGNLNKAIELLDNNYKEDFKKFLDDNTSFNPHNMFMCKTKILKNYYESLFPWLEKCEKIFGFSDSGDYGSKRIYGFLAERFLSFWFTKNYKYLEIPIIGKDLGDYKDL